LLGAEVSPDGSIVFLDLNADFVLQRIGTDGILTRIAGTGVQCPFDGSEPCGDGGPAIEARLFSLRGQFAFGPDGSLYFSDGNGVRRIRPDGIIEAVAGNPVEQGFSGDGGPAITARLCQAESLAFGPDGSLFVADAGNRRIRQITPDGLIATVAGGGPSCQQTGQVVQDGPARQTPIIVRDLAVTPDGTLLAMLFDLENVAQRNNSVRRIGSALPDFTGAEFIIASTDGRLLYAFDATGRHLATFDALTGAAQRLFVYDADGLLAEVVEQRGTQSDVTAIERDPDGTPNGIVGPFGHRTTLATDANGFLSAITTPAGDATTLVSTPSGLLTSFTAPGNRTSTFEYDTAGRLERHEDPEDGARDLDRTGEPTDFAVTATTALARTTAYASTQTVDGER
jgi:YD repeat-containing protein